MPANTITVVGNLTADPEIRRTGNDVPYIRMRVAVNTRFRNVDTKEWEERTDGFFSVTAWREMAEHCRRSLCKGDRVTVTGKLTRREYEAKVDGGGTETRNVHEIEADDIGASLRWRSWSRLEPRTVDADGTTSPATGGAADPDEPPTTADKAA